MTVFSLEMLGWSEALTLALPARPDVRPARVAAVHGLRADVWTTEGPRRAIARSRAKRSLDEVGGLVVGDWVLVADVPGDVREVVIEAILPRRSCFVRQAAGERAEPQAIAANVDRVYVVTSLEGDFNVRRIERYLVALEGSGATAAIVLGKADLCPDPSAIARAASALAPTFVVSARTGQGLAELRASMPVGTTSALVGSSGVGKSALVNRLVDRAMQLEGAVREYDKKGRHTTTRRELFVVAEGGLLVDTPGMRELKPWRPDGEPHDDDAFEDVAAVAERCRYRDCRHTSEPGCAVLEALASGALDKERVASWHKLEEERAAHGARQAASAGEKKRRAKVMTAALRKRLRDKF